MSDDISWMDRKRTEIHATLNTTNNGNLAETIMFKTNRKVTIIRNRREKETHFSFTVAVPNDFIKMLRDAGKFMGDYEEGSFYLKESEDKGYEIIYSKTTPPNAKIINVDFTKDSTTITLTKRPSIYLQAYDRYLHTIEKINKKMTKTQKFEAQTMYADIELRTQINEPQNTVEDSIFYLSYELHILLSIHLDPVFVTYIKKHVYSSEGLPWWVTLLGKGELATKGGDSID